MRPNFAEILTEIQPSLGAPLPNLEECFKTFDTFLWGKLYRKNFVSSFDLSFDVSCMVKLRSGP